MKVNIARMSFKIIAGGFRSLIVECSRASRLFAAFEDMMLRVQVGLRRTQLEIALMRGWYVPNDIAYWLSQWWPKRFLPKLRPELWEWDEGETE